MKYEKLLPTQLKLSSLFRNSEFTSERAANKLITRQISIFIKAVSVLQFPLNVAIIFNKMNGLWILFLDSDEVLKVSI